MIVAVLGTAIVAAGFCLFWITRPEPTSAATVGPSTVDYALGGDFELLGSQTNNHFLIWQSSISQVDNVVADLPGVVVAQAAPKILPQVEEEVQRVLRLVERATTEAEAEVARRSYANLAAWLAFLAAISYPTNDEYDFDRVLLIQDATGQPIVPVSPACRNTRFEGDDSFDPSTVQCSFRAGDLPELHVYAEAGEDTVYLAKDLSWLSKRTVHGGSDHDEIFGSDQRDLIVGGLGPDKLRGYGEEDWLIAAGDGSVDDLDCGSPNPTNPSPGEGDLADVDFEDFDTMLDCEDPAWPELAERWR